MLLQCNVSISAEGELGRWSRAKVGLCKQKKISYLMVTTATKSYKFPMDNLKRVHSAALEFEPNRVVNLRNADPYQLKVLMKQCSALAAGKMDKALLPSMKEQQSIKPKPTSVSVMGKNYTKDTFRNQSLENVKLAGTSPLPKAIWDLRNLTSITLNQCGLVELPPSFLKIASNLKIVDVSQNKIKRIEPLLLGQLKNVVCLNLSQNCLRFLPLNIIRLQQLSVLNLSDNKIHNLPFTFATLRKLKELNFANNCITSFNQSFMAVLNGKFNLIKLDLSNNRPQVYETRERPSQLPDLFSLAAAQVLKDVNKIYQLCRYLPYDMEDFINIRAELCTTCQKPFLRFNTGELAPKPAYLGRIAQTIFGSVGSHNHINLYKINCFYCDQKALDLLDKVKVPTKK